MRNQETPKSPELSEEVKTKAFHAAMQQDEYFSSRFVGNGPDDCRFRIRDENPMEGTLSIQVIGHVKSDPKISASESPEWMVNVEIKA